ncbi:MAG: hypothetical protein ACYDG5_01635 [Dehalococcoidales bacterium]
MRKLTYLTKHPEYFISLALISMLLTVFVPSLPALAAPLVTLIPSSGAVGTSVAIAGTVFDSYKGDNIHVFFDAIEIQNSPVIVPMDGAFSINFTIPASANAGQHWIEVRSETTSSSMLAKKDFTVDTTALTIATPEGCVGDTISIGGSGYYVGMPVTLYFMDVTQDELGKTTASGTGRFTHQVVIPVSAAGFHRIIATNDAGNRAEAQFKVLPQLKLDLASAGPGDSVTTSGTGFARGSTITLFFGLSNVASAQTDDLGSFTVDFTVPSVKSTSYEVKAQDGQGNTGTAQFAVTAGATLSKTVGATGSDLTINGSGFIPGRSINIYYDDTLIATTFADNNGDFTATFTVPAGGGNHIITVGDGTTTKKYTFTLEKVPPPTPVLCQPCTNSFIQADTVFDWTDVTDISVPVTYSLEIATDQNFSTLNFKKTGIKDSQCALTGDDIISAAFKGAAYFWRVKATDGAGNEGEWSAPWIFYVSVPPAPTLTSPAAAATVALPIHFSWQSSSSLSLPLTYTLQIAASPDFATTILNKSGITAAEYVISEESDANFENNINYYWRVKVVDNAYNSSDWSTAGSFYFFSAAGFPAWATYTLISVGSLLVIMLAFRAGRRIAYH